MSEKLDIAKLRELEAKATPGPWDVQCLGDAVRHLNRNVDHESYCFRSHDDAEPHGVMPGRYDGKFLAELRNSAPALLAAAEERDRFRAALEEVAAVAVFLRSADPTEPINQAEVTTLWELATEALAGKAGAK